MADVGTIIPTPHGLSTVVRVLPSHNGLDSSTDPSQVVALPVGSSQQDVLPSEYFGVPMPGQAQSAANFVQTLIMPPDGTSSATDSTSTDTADLAAAQNVTTQTSTTAAATPYGSADSGLLGLPLGGENAATAEQNAASQPTDNTSTSSATAATTGSATSGDRQNGDQATAQAVAAKAVQTATAAHAYQAAQHRGQSSGTAVHMVG